MLDHLKSGGYSHAVSLVRHIGALEERIREHHRILEGLKGAISTNRHLQLELQDTRKRLAVMEEDVPERLKIFYEKVWLSDFSTPALVALLNFINRSKYFFKSFPRNSGYILSSSGTLTSGWGMPV